MLKQIVLLIIVVSYGKGWDDVRVRRFPDRFLFGVATSAYQIEGAWKSDGKGVSIWDTFVHNHVDNIADRSNGDVAADSYRLYKRDVEMLRELSVDHYRFSISWTRIAPNGHTNVLNEDGLLYYDNLINELVKYNIIPMVTLYHFDLPQILQDLGGWANPESVEWFEDYARVLFDRYASRVKYWITFNQPNSICIEGYGEGTMAPGVSLNGIADYICVKNVLLAHARVWRLYDEHYRRRFGGEVGIALAVNWLDPFDNTTESKQATEEYREFTIGLYMNPIFSKTGDFPKVVKDIIARKSKEQGYPKSRLPELTPDVKNYIRGTADFLAMNHYTTFLVKRARGVDFEVPSFADDTSVVLSHGEKWKKAKSSWLASAPYGIYKACLYLNKLYDYPNIIVTESGWSTGRGIKDTGRVNYLNYYLDALLLALEDGTEMKGFTFWTLMDNFEWTAGFSERFGLYEMEFESRERRRVPRLSALVYRHVIETRVVDHEWRPSTIELAVSDRRIRLKNKTEL